MIVERIELDEMPFDRDFGDGLVHATGYAVRFDDIPDIWCYEYVNHDGTYIYS